eukprot:NODE_530_length_7152_cov_0.525876.p2 type:complete len:534 gc:universal NODE_530_length_7152_cov_0.525876:1826-225(-)
MTNLDIDIQKLRNIMSDTIQAHVKISELSFILNRIQINSIQLDDQISIVTDSITAQSHINKLSSTISKIQDTTQNQLTIENECNTTSIDDSPSYKENSFIRKQFFNATKPTSKLHSILPDDTNLSLYESPIVDCQTHIPAQVKSEQEKTQSEFKFIPISPVKSLATATRRVAAPVTSYSKQEMHNILRPFLKKDLQITSETANSFLSLNCTGLAEYFKDRNLTQYAGNFIQNLITHASFENLDNLINSFYTGNLLELARSNYSMPTIKFLIHRLGKENLYHRIESLFLELLNKQAIWSLLQSPFNSVVVKFLDFQTQFSENTNLLLVAHITTKANEKDGNLYFNIITLNGNEGATAGSLLLQHLFKNIHLKNNDVLDSLFALEEERHVSLMMHRAASHFYRSFYSSLLILEGSKVLFFDKFILSNCVKLANDSYASLIIQDCWSTLDIDRRLSLIEVLYQHKHEWSSTPHGHYLNKHLNLYVYSRDVQYWRRIQMGNNSRETVNESCIEPGLQRVSRKRRTRRMSDRKRLKNR